MIPDTLTNHQLASCIDLSIDSYEELQHSLPMDFSDEAMSNNNNNNKTHGLQAKPDRLDQLLEQDVDTDRFTIVQN